MRRERKMAAPGDAMALMQERLLITGMLMAALWLLPTEAAAQSGTAAKAPDSKALLHALEDAFGSVADRVTPSVVNVSVKPKKAPPGEGGQAPPPEGEQRFREFFG